jgi:hypothetical protein
MGHDPLIWLKTKRVNIFLIFCIGQIMVGQINIFEMSLRRPGSCPIWSKQSTGKAIPLNIGRLLRDRHANLRSDMIDEIDSTDETVQPFSAN